MCERERERERESVLVYVFICVYICVYMCVYVCGCENLPDILEVGGKGGCWRKQRENP